MNTELKNKLQSKSAKVGIIGLGYVGLPLALLLANKNFEVIGYDCSEEKVNKLNQGYSDVQDISSEELLACIKKEKFSATKEASILKECDVAIICVPTPLNEHQEPDVSFIEKAVEDLIRYWGQEKLIILESTTYPGTTQEVIIDRIEETGLQIGKDFYACYSPERVDPGNKKFKTENTPKVIGASDQVSLELGISLYQQVIVELVKVNTLEIAEMSKLVENTFRCINIAFVNELMMLSEKLNIDIWETLEAAATKPFGFMKFLPGPGVGGHCIPLDPSYLSWRAKTANFFNRFVETAQDINYNMPGYVSHSVMRLLNHSGKCLSQSKILLLGMAYKTNVGDLRESPGLVLYELLKKEGTHVDFCDPLVGNFKDKNGEVIHSQKYEAKLFSEYDLVIVMTKHELFSEKIIIENSNLVLDTQNSFQNKQASNIKQLGTIFN